MNRADGVDAAWCAYRGVSGSTLSDEMDLESSSGFAWFAGCVVMLVWGGCWWDPPWVGAAA
jgi:hypothetical protein